MVNMVQNGQKLVKNGLNQSKTVKNGQNGHGVRKVYHGARNVYHSLPSQGANVQNNMKD